MHIIAHLEIWPFSWKEYSLVSLWSVYSFFLFGILRIPPLVNHKGNDVNSDWLADQWDERSVLGYVQFHKRRMKGGDPKIDTAQTPKRFDWRLALLGKIRKTFTDSIPNNFGQIDLFAIWGKGLGRVQPILTA